MDKDRWERKGFLDHSQRWSPIEFSSLRQVTRRLDIIECIEDIDVDSTLSDVYLHIWFPKDVTETQTTLCCRDKNLTEAIDKIGNNLNIDIFFWKHQ